MAPVFAAPARLRVLDGAASMSFVGLLGGLVMSGLGSSQAALATPLGRGTRTSRLGIGWPERGRGRTGGARRAACCSRRSVPARRADSAEIAVVTLAAKSAGIADAGWLAGSLAVSAWV